MKTGKRLGFLLILILAVFFASTIALAEAVSPKYDETLNELFRALKAYQDLHRVGGSYDVLFRRDPMRPLVDAKGRVVHSVGIYSNLAVQGIVQSTDLNVVLVDDHFYAPGDHIGPYRILEIRPDGLRVEQEGQELFIPLYPDSSTPSENKL